MATYNELYDLIADTVLRNRVTMACLIAAEVIRNEAANTANHAQRLLWAKTAFENARGESERMLMAVLAQNAALTKAQITGATDAQLQTAVNVAVNTFTTGV